MTMPAPLRPDKAPWPLPLEYDGDACVHDAQHRPVVDCFDCEDAEFIVRACNAHYELLAALKAFNFSESAIIGGTADTLTLRVPIKTLQDAAAAIARAESGL